MINILILAIFILPWLIIPNNHLPDPTRIIKSATFDFAMMAIIAMALINGLKFEYKNKYLGWLSLAVFFGFAFNWYYPLMAGYGYNAGTIDGNLHFLLSVIATVCVCSTFERNDFVKIAKAVVFSATLVAIFAALQAIGLDPMKKVANYTTLETRHVCALLDHPDILGNYLALSVPFFLYLFRAKYVIPFLIVIFVLIVAHSSLSILGAGVACFIFFALKYRNSKYWRIGLSVLFVLGIVFCLNPKFNKLNTGFTGRVDAWQQILARADNPIFGQGLGIVKSYGVQYGSSAGMNHWVFAHNDYIEMYCAGGILLLFLFALLVIHSLRKFNYKIDNHLGFAYLGSFLCFLVLMLGSFPMEIAPLALGGLISFWGLEKL